MNRGVAIQARVCRPGRDHAGAVAEPLLRFRVAQKVPLSRSDRHRGALCASGRRRRVQSAPWGSLPVTNCREIMPLPGASA